MKVHSSFHLSQQIINKDNDNNNNYMLVDKHLKLKNNNKQLPAKMKL
jgi:hypothetical protein